MNARKRYFAVIQLILFLAAAAAYADEVLDKVEDLIQNNKLNEAKPLLVAAVQAGTKDESYFLYLGYIYEYEKNYTQAEVILKKGLEISLEKKKAGMENICDVMYFNLANIYNKLKDPVKADQMYSTAIENNYGFSEAYLNRANLRTTMKEWQKAIDDYSRYLLFEPNDNQKDSIQSIIAILNNKILTEEEAKRVEDERKKLAEEAKRLEEERRKQEEEAKRIKEEEEKRLAEEERIKKEEEQRKKEEEAKRIEDERQKALLEAILSSLEDASSDTQNLSAGSESLITNGDSEDELAD